MVSYDRPFVNGGLTAIATTLGGSLATVSPQRVPDTIAGHWARHSTSPGATRTNSGAAGASACLRRDLECP